MTTCSFIKTVSKCDSQLKVMIEKNLSGAERFWWSPVWRRIRSVFSLNWTLFHSAMRAAATLFELVFCQQWIQKPLLV